MLDFFLLGQWGCALEVVLLVIGIIGVLHDRVMMKQCCGSPVFQNGGKPNLLFLQVLKKLLIESFTLVGWIGRFLMLESELVGAWKLRADRWSLARLIVSVTTQRQCGCLLFSWRRGCSWLLRKICWRLHLIQIVQSYFNFILRLQSVELKNGFTFVRRFNNHTVLRNRALISSTAIFFINLLFRSLRFFRLRMSFFVLSHKEYLILIHLLLNV